jgi:hypothetical protein
MNATIPDNHDEIVIEYDPAINSGYVDKREPDDRAGGVDKRGGDRFSAVDRREPTNRYGSVDRRDRLGNITKRDGFPDFLRHDDGALVERKPGSRAGSLDKRELSNSSD